eukprot:COSAG02_NODE_62983_length_264_cov_0.921212_1_plen_70_part_01
MNPDCDSRWLSLWAVEEASEGQGQGRGQGQGQGQGQGGGGRGEGLMAEGDRKGELLPGKAELLQRIPDAR